MVDELEKQQLPRADMPSIVTDTSGKAVFPYPDSVNRLNDYEYFERLFLGNHYEAFRIRIDDDQYNKAYSRLRYVMINFAGLISKIVADMLFSEPIVIKAPDGDQEFIEALWRENKMDVQCYESALSNSYLGDALFKIRTGQRREGSTDPSTVIIEDITPSIYFPEVNQFNVRAVPKSEELAWTFRVGNDDYLRKEVHKMGLIENHVYKMRGNVIEEEVDLSILGIDGLMPVVPTGVTESLLTHVVNWKAGNRYFGLSDYYDLDSIFYAINNRMTKTDNVLDKHGDPILMVPPGVMDEKGQVKKKALGVIEIDEENQKPEYVVWDASLENAFKQVEKLVEFMYMIGEVSPDVLGLGQGVSDSGRALKFKLMRTIAKVQRKKLYYDLAIKQLLYTAQLMAKVHGLEVGDERIKGEPVVPEIEWADGLPIDNSEQIDTEIKAVDAGLTSKKAAIMRIYGVDEEAADEMLKEVKDEKTIALPKPNFGTNPPFGKTDVKDGGENGTVPFASTDK